MQLLKSENVRRLISKMKISTLAVGLLSSQSVLAQVIEFNCSGRHDLDALQKLGFNQEMLDIFAPLELKITILVDLTNRSAESGDRIYTDIVISPNKILIPYEEDIPVGEFTDSISRTKSISRIDLSFEDTGGLPWSGTCEIVENKVERVF